MAGNRTESTKRAVPNGKRLHTRLDQIEDDVTVFFLLTFEKLQKKSHLKI